MDVRTDRQTEVKQYTPLWWSGGIQNSTKLSPSREATPYIRPIFHCRNSGLSEEDNLFVFYKFRASGIFPDKRCGLWWEWSCKETTVHKH